MGKYVLSKILSLVSFTFFFSFLNISCQEPQQKKINELNNPETQKIKEKVQFFFELVRQKETKKAMELFIDKSISPQEIFKEQKDLSNNDESPQFDWATFLFNRHLFNQGIKDARISSGDGSVVVKLGDNGISLMEGKFSLRKINDDWKIYSVEFNKIQ